MTGPRRSRRLLVLAVAATALSAVGCSSLGPARPTAQVPVVDVTAAAQIDLPLLHYLETEAERELILRAVTREETTCAERFGVVLPPAELERGALSAGIDASRRYGLVNVAEAERDGYLKPKEAVPGPRQEGLAAEVLSGWDAAGKPSKLTDADGDRVYDEGGCGSVGHRAVFGDVSAGWDKTARRLLANSFRQLVGSPAYQQAERDWASCMAAAGHEFVRRADAAASVADAPAKEAVAMAVLDAKCGLEVNYVGRAMAVDAAIQRQLIRENEGVLRGAVEQKEKLLEQAAAALQTSSPTR